MFPRSQSFSKIMKGDFNICCQADISHKVHKRLLKNGTWFLRLCCNNARLFTPGSKIWRDLMQYFTRRSPKMPKSVLKHKSWKNMDKTLLSWPQGLMGPTHKLRGNCQFVTVAPDDLLVKSRQMEPSTTIVSYCHIQYIIYINNLIFFLFIRLWSILIDLMIFYRMALDD